MTKVSLNPECNLNINGIGLIIIISNVTHTHTLTHSLTHSLTHTHTHTHTHTLRRRDVYIFYNTVFYFSMVIFDVLTLTQFTVFEYVTSAIVFRPQHASSIKETFLLNL